MDLEVSPERPCGPPVASAPRAPEALTDLADRWRRARRAALRRVTPAGTTEEELLPVALGADPEGAGRHVFDHSLALGRGFARYYAADLTLPELPDALGQLGVPCLHGTWRAAADEPALFLERAGCPAGALGADACDYFREAIFGLVLGLTGGVRHARHESVGHGSGRCLDVLHADPESPARYGVIPEEMREALEGVRRMARAFDSAAEVRFLGVSEGVLLYRIERSGRAGEISVRTLVERGVRRRLPDLELCEITPRPVLGADE